MLPAGDRLAQLAEVGQASLIQDDDFAVDDRALDAKFTSGLSQVTILRRPVEPAPGEDPHTLVVDDDLGAITVELHLVNPSVAFGRLLHKGRHHWRNERKPDPAGRLTHRNPTQLEFDSI